MILWTYLMCTFFSPPNRNTTSLFWRISIRSFLFRFSVSLFNKWSAPSLWVCRDWHNIWGRPDSMCQPIGRPYTKIDVWLPARVHWGYRNFIMRSNPRIPDGWLCHRQPFWWCHWQIIVWLLLVFSFEPIRGDACAHHRRWSVFARRHHWCCWDRICHKLRLWARTLLGWSSTWRPLRTLDRGWAHLIERIATFAIYVLDVAYFLCGQEHTRLVGEQVKIVFSHEPCVVGVKLSHELVNEIEILSTFPIHLQFYFVKYLIGFVFPVHPPWR